MGLQNEEADSHRGVGLLKYRIASAEELVQGNEVAKGLAHLPSLDGNQVVVHPVLDSAGSPFRKVLSHLALVMREHKVHSSAVDIKLLSEIFFSHSGALHVPSRETVSPRGRPAHNVLRTCLFPESEVCRRMFVLLPVQLPCIMQHLVQIPSAEGSVIVLLGIFCHVKINGTVAYVSIAVIQNLLDELYLLDYVA